MTLYSKLSLEERKQIKCLLSRGLGVNAIARHLHRSNSTISRELKRTVGETEVYCPTIAHITSQKQQQLRRFGKRKIDLQLGSLVETCLTEYHFSPEQISHYLERHHAIDVRRSSRALAKRNE
jgi:transposase, IS30 family